MSKKKSSHARTAVVDGANVAYLERTAKGKPRIANLIAVRRALEDEGYDPIIIVDASLIHEVDDRQQLDALIENQTIRQVPAGTDADFFVLTTAEQQDGVVVSNDRYDPYQHEFPWIRERRIPLMIVEGQVQLYDPEVADAR